MQMKEYKLLILDHDSDSREICRKYLSTDPAYMYTFVEAETAHQALTLCKSEFVDGVLSNYWLPDGSGIEFLNQLKGQLETQNRHFCPPVVLLGEPGYESAVVTAIKSGAEDYLVKPLLTQESLCTSMRSALENTELRRRLQQSEERFHTSVENMLSCFGIYSAIRDESGKIEDFRVEYVNAAACENNQLSQDEQVGKRLCDILPSHRESGLFDDYCRLVETGIPLVKEALIYRDRYGHEVLSRAFDIRASKLGDGFVASWHDITAQKQTEMALQESEERFRLLAENIPDAVFWMSIPEQDQLLYVSPSYEKIWGMSCDSVYADYSQWVNVIHEDDRARVRSTFLNGRIGETCEVEYRIVRPDGTVRWVRDRAFPLFPKEDEPVRVVGIAEDITKRKQTEKALQESEQLLSLALSSAHAGVWSWEIPTSKVRWSPENYDLYGIAPDTPLQYEIWYNAIHPEDREQINGEVVRVIEERLPEFRSEFRIVHPQRGIRWLLGLGRITYNSEGDAVYFSGVNLDITDQKLAHQMLERQVVERTSTLRQVNQNLKSALRSLQQSEERSRQQLIALQTSEAQYRRIVETTKEGVWELDATGKTTVVNQQMATMLGYTEAEMQEKRLFDLIDDAGRAIALEYWERLQQGISVQQDFKFRHVDGSDVWAIVSASPVLDSQEQCIGVLCMVTDITDRKRAEKQIQEQAALLDITTDAIIVRDLDNRILYWNKGAERIFGWTAAETLGKCTKEFWPQASVSEQEYALQQVLKHGSWLGELTKSTKNGTSVILQSRWTRMDDDAKHPIAVLTVDTDITEQKRLEAQFLRAQRLESIGILAGGIAHDLNNILNPMLTVSELLPRKLTNLDDHSLRLLDILGKSARRGADLVKQILTFAQGSTEGKRSVISIEHVLIDGARFAEYTFPKNIKIQVDLPETPLPSVFADTTQLQQVLMNLCVNARDAMPDGGTLRISAHHCELGQRDAPIHPDAYPGDYVVITIADTGCGIPPDTLARIFDPFFTTKDAGKGTGLGLSTTLGIIKNHGGFLTVSSTVHEGTEFQVYLPGITDSVC